MDLLSATGAMAGTPGRSAPAEIAASFEDLAGFSDFESLDAYRPRRSSPRKAVVKLGGDEASLLSPSSGVPSEAPDRLGRRVSSGSEATEALKNLHRERARLVQRDLSKGLEERDRRRLRYLEWQIDRLESERMAPALVVLERIAEREGAFAAHLAEVARVAKGWRNAPSQRPPSR